MLAFASQWDPSPSLPANQISLRLGRSLCAGIGGEAGSASISGMNFAYRPLRSTSAVRAWSPAILPDGTVAVFHGYFDNIDEISDALGAKHRDPALIYGLAVQRWGEGAELRILGEYCAILVDQAKATVRLARSPLRAPPLHYYHDENLVAAASVPRALFAAGVPSRLNRLRAADSTLLNFSDRESSWFEGISRVPIDSIVELERGKPRRLHRYYDLLTMPKVRLASDADYITRAQELLDEGVRTCLAGFHRPGCTLSAGLDSPQVVLSAIQALPTGRKLPTFTFHPEPGYDGITEPNFLGDERPFVEMFAAMHPAIEPHFTDNRGYEHDYRWNDLFHVMGGAPSGLCNMYVFHGLFSLAREQECDLLLVAEWGNYTFSDNGIWAYVEYLLTGRWWQLWRALTRMKNDSRPLPLRFAIRSLSPLLPDALWRLAKRAMYPGREEILNLVTPLSTDFRKRSGADERVRRSGLNVDRYQPWSRRHAQSLLFASDDAETAEVYQAFEQLYGIAQRDPLAYRPFVEFCFGLPTKMFMRDGEPRWLAKQLARGKMPEPQRENRLNGRWDSDWHLRIGRRREGFLAELDRMASDPEFSTMFDIPRLRASLEDWPDETPDGEQDFFTREMAVPRALLTARFIDYVEGRNSV